MERFILNKRKMRKTFHLPALWQQVRPSLLFLPGTFDLHAPKDIGHTRWISLQKQKQKLNFLFLRTDHQWFKEQKCKLWDQRTADVLPEASYT